MNERDGTADAAIDQAVAHWRVGVRHLDGAELDELADHVASSARTVMEGGLEPDEAVLIAARRLGAARELVREYERGDGRARSFDPLGLILVGAAAALVAAPLARVVGPVAALVAHSLGLGTSPWAAAVAAFALLAPIALLIPLRRWRGAAGALTVVARRPLIALAIVLALWVLPFVVQIGLTHALSPGEYGQFVSVSWPFHVAAFVIAPLALLAVGLHRTRRARCA